MKRHPDTATELPPPPREFFLAVKRAKRQDPPLWVKAARRARRGEARYVVTPAHSGDVLFAHDDIEAVLTWLGD